MKKSRQHVSHNFESTFINYFFDMRGLRFNIKHLEIIAHELTKMMSSDSIQQLEQDIIDYIER